MKGQKGKGKDEKKELSHAEALAHAHGKPLKIQKREPRTKVFVIRLTPPVEGGK